MVWGAVIGLAVSQVLGILWYSPLLFGNRWMKTQHPNRNPAEVGRGAAIPISLAFMGVLVVVLHFIIGHYLAITSVCEAVKVALVLGVMETLIDVPHLMYNGRPIIVFIIDHLFNAAVIMEMCGFIAGFD